MYRLNVQVDSIVGCVTELVVKQLVYISIEMRFAKAVGDNVCNEKA